MITELRARANADPRAYGPRTRYERDAAIHDVFSVRARATPDAVAIIDALGSVTYDQLERSANRLARYLAAVGVLPGTSIGVAFERSRNMPIAFLAILKAGCAYVPLDASFPPERIAFIVGDAAIALVIVERELPDAGERFSGARVVSLTNDAAAIDAQLDAAFGVTTGPLARAYVMYTSGSTGRAKGVAIAHRGVVRLVRGADYFTTLPGETFLAFAPAAFDASTFEIWGALLNGARLAIPREGLHSVDDLAAAIDRFSVTTLWLTASIFARVVEAQAPAFGALRQLLTGGSAGSPQHMARFVARYPQCRLINGYGPTENTTFSTTYHLASAEAIGMNPPIGRPIANASAHVLDETLRPVAPGVTGELYVGGDGVGLGYLNLPAETAARFLPDPFSAEPGARLYRTGDRARMREDGVIEFLGRSDDQVKINGFRIELGEIEAVLRALPGVGDAAVVVVERESGEKALAAHVVPSVRSRLDEQQLRASLRMKLPAFMVPPHITVTARLPLHPSGKIDRIALAAIPVAAVRPPGASAQPAAGPQNVRTLSRPLLDRAVAAIWRETLADERAVDVHANFFDAGGDSIRLLRLHTLLTERLGADISVLDLFEYTTIARIADLVAERARA